MGTLHTSPSADQRSAGQGTDADIVLEHPHEGAWLNGFGAVRDLPASREGQRLIRTTDWDHSGPYLLLAVTNNRIIKPCVSLARAEEYLRDLGMREFDVQVALYHAELWARRQGSVQPLYPLRESDPVLFFDLVTETVVGEPAPRCTCGAGKAVRS
jgi:hypothetical protein